MELRVQDTLQGPRQITIKNGKKGRLISDLKNTIEFERLKNIQQISYSSEAFPNARHSRYEHSLGVYHLADQILRSLKDLHPKTYDPHQALIVRVRAILHDIGHGARSHSWEGVMKALGHTRSHEEWGHFIVSDPHTEVNRVLREYDETLYEDVRQSFLREEPASFWDTIISSQFDADRLDYLQRDAQNSGIAIGINEGHLLNNLKLSFSGAANDIVLAFDPKAEDSVNQFLQSRAMIYSTLSHNKHSESSDALMQHVFVKMQQLFRKYSPEELGFNPEDSHIKIIMADPDQVSVEDYLYVDDNVLSAFLKKLSVSTDERLGGVPRQAGLLSKSKPLYVCDFIKEMPRKSAHAVDRALEIFEDMKQDYPDCFSGSFATRKPAYKKTTNPFNKIWIANGGEAMEISDRISMPDEIVVGCVFSESEELIVQYKQRLKSDPELKAQFGGSYGIPKPAVPAPQML